MALFCSPLSISHGIFKRHPFGGVAIAGVQPNNSQSTFHPATEIVCRTTGPTVLNDPDCIQYCIGTVLLIHGSCCTRVLHIVSGVAIVLNGCSYRRSWNRDTGSIPCCIETAGHIKTMIM